MRKVFMFLALFFASCSGTSSGRLTKPGVFPSPKGAKILNIDIDTKEVVKFTVSDSLSKKILISEVTGSAYQKWFFFWESETVLWVQSSDIGLLKVIKFGPRNEVLDNKILNHNSRELAKIPNQVREGLPN